MKIALATVIIPTHDHVHTLPLSVASALSQAFPVEIFIIGDGVSTHSRKVISELAAKDSRIRFFDNPKHKRRGEPYRNLALREAKGQIVCYLCDRDLWMPDHVERMANLLAEADFSHSLPFHIMPGDHAVFFGGDLSLPIFRHIMLNINNQVPLSCAAHRLDFYQTHTDGWTTTPQGKLTDWHMFQKFLALKDCRCKSGTWPSALTFPSKPRLAWTQEQRFAELRRWHSQIAEQSTRTKLAVAILESAIRSRDKARAQIMSQGHIGQ